MSKTKAEPQHPDLNNLEQIGGKALAAMSTIAEANQRVVARLVELSSSVAADRVQVMGELGAAAMDAVRGALASMDGREVFESFHRDPFTWYRKGALSALDGTERLVKLMQTSAQIVARDAERLQASCLTTGREIESHASACASRLRDICRQP